MLESVNVELRELCWNTRRCEYSEEDWNQVKRYYSEWAQCPEEEKQLILNTSWEDVLRLLRSGGEQDKVIRVFNPIMNSSYSVSLYSIIYQSASDKVSESEIVDEDCLEPNDIVISI